MSRGLRSSLSTLPKDAFIEMTNEYSNMYVTGGWKLIRIYFIDSFVVDIYISTGTDIKGTHISGFIKLQDALEYIRNSGVFFGDIDGHSSHTWRVPKTFVDIWIKPVNTGGETAGRSATLNTAREQSLDSFLNNKAILEAYDNYSPSLEMNLDRTKSILDTLENFFNINRSK